MSSVCVASSSYQWYSWGPPNMQCRLCASCWTYWKKYGGLKMPTRLEGERPGPNRNSMVSKNWHVCLDGHWRRRDSEWALKKGLCVWPLREGWGSALQSWKKNKKMCVARAPMVCPCGTAAALSSPWRPDRHFASKPRVWRGWRAVSARTSLGRGTWPGTPTSLSTQPPSRQNVTTSRSILLIFLLLFFPKLFFRLVPEGALRLPDSPKKPSPVKPVKRKPLESVVRYLGETVCFGSSFSPPSLLTFPLHSSSSASTVAHPRPAKPDPPARGGSISTGSLTPIKSSPILNNGSPTILGKRTYEQHNGLDGEWQDAGLMPTLGLWTLLVASGTSGASLTSHRDTSSGHSFLFAEYSHHWDPVLGSFGGVLFLGCVPLSPLLGEVRDGEETD